MDKEEFIAQYGEAAYQKKWDQATQWNNDNPERMKANHKKWYKNHPEKSKQVRNEWQRKSGRHYEKKAMYDMTGLRRERNNIRCKHANRWRKYKRNWLTETEIHHEWIPRTAEYNGIAIVDKSEHQYEIIDPIVILEGKVELIGIGGI